MLLSRKMLSDVQLCSSLPQAKSLRVTTPRPTARRNNGHPRIMALHTTDAPSATLATTLAKTLFWVGTQRDQDKACVPAFYP